MRVVAAASFLLLVPALCLSQGAGDDPTATVLEAKQDVVSEPEALPEATMEAIAAVGASACRDAVPDCRGDVEADLELIARHVFADTMRAVDVQANRRLFSDPGRIATAAERAMLFADVITHLYRTNPYSSEPDLLPTTLKESRYSHADDQTVTDYGLSLATGLLAELMARHYESTGQLKAAEQTRSWVVPLVDVSLVRADSSAVTETSVEASWMRSFMTFLEVAAGFQTTDQAGHLLDQQLQKLAAEMHSIHQTLRTGVLAGVLFDDNKDIDDPTIFGATDNQPLEPELEQLMREATRAQVVLQERWLHENRLGSVQEINAMLEPVRQMAAIRTSSALATPDQDLPAPIGPWGPEVVAGEGYFEQVFVCNEAGSPTARHECALLHGVPPAAVAFSRAVEAPEGMILATGFMELGVVDVVYNNLHAAWFQYLVNGQPDIITIELTDPKTWYADAMAQVAFAGEGEVRVHNSEVTGCRLMPDGGQRLVVVDRIVSACETCPMGGLGLRHVDFDASGTLRGARAAGILPWEALFSEDEDPHTLRTDPRWLQYRLARFGFEPGVFDGEPGFETRVALADFAREHCAEAQLDSDLIFDTLAMSDPLMPAPCAGVPANAEPAAGGMLIGRFELGPDTGMRCTADWAPVQLYTNRIMYHETGCDLDIPVAPDFAEHRTTTTCHGEGESWKESVTLLRRATGELTIVKDGYTFDYTMCPE